MEPNKGEMPDNEQHQPPQQQPDVNNDGTGDATADPASTVEPHENADATNDNNRPQTPPLHLVDQTVQPQQPQRRPSPPPQQQRQAILTPPGTPESQISNRSLSNHSSPRSRGSHNGQNIPAQQRDRVPGTPDSNAAVPRRQIVPATPGTPGTPLSQSALTTPRSTPPNSPRRNRSRNGSPLRRAVVPNTPGTPGTPPGTPDSHSAGRVVERSLDDSPRRRSPPRSPRDHGAANNSVDDNDGFMDGDMRRAVIWGTTVSVDDVFNRFRRFIRDFVDPSVSDEPLYLQKLDELIQTGPLNLNIDCAHLSSWPATRRLYRQLLSYPQEIIPLMDLVVNKERATRLEVCLVCFVIVWPFARVAVDPVSDVSYWGWAM